MAKQTETTGSVRMKERPCRISGRSLYDVAAPQEKMLQPLHPIARMRLA
jgi:hypothetical protein